MNGKTETIIVKYLMNEANIEELNSLTVWIKNPKNKRIFKNFVEANYAIDINTKQFELENTKKEYLNKIRRDHYIFYKYRLHKIGIYAAVLIIGSLTTVHFLKDSLFNSKVDSTTTSIVNTNSIVPGTDKATLTIANGEKVPLGKGTSYQTPNASSNGEQIIYTTNDNKVRGAVEHVEYNYLTIPRGGQFYIVLSDGTKVWLNSESQLKYPVTFIDGRERQVELVYGEAYFDVSPSTENQGSKFIVLNKSQKVEVLGTEFNIKAYSDEPNIYTTLVEGKVAIVHGNKKEYLHPNQQSNLSLDNNDVSINSVNLYNEIAWKEGIFTFRRKSLEDIMRVLSRWYDIEVVFENSELKTAGFNGVVGKDQNIEEILELIKGFGVITDFEIKNKTVMIK